jgi:hypothetical protein
LETGAGFEGLAVTEETNLYSQRYVAFIDILGFGNIVRQSVQLPGQAAALLQIFDRMHKRWSDEALKATHANMGDDFRVQSFSDCTVMSEAATPRGLAHLLLMVTQFTLELMGQGFLVRGGVAKGLLHHADKAVFGPAFLDAYALERDIACFPRIVVDKGTHKDFESTNIMDTWDEFTRPKLCYGDDGPVFVDVLSAFRILEQDRVYTARVVLNGQNILSGSQEPVRLSSKKKKWHTFSFLRKGSVRIQQVAFTTTMIVAYARPFSPGRGNLNFPNRLLGYSKEEQLLHDRLLVLRNKEYAHADASTYKVTPFRGDLGVKSMQSIRDVRFTIKDIDLFLQMTKPVIGRVDARMEELRQSGNNEINEA